MADARLGRDAWIEAALEALAAGGVGAVSVEPLARALGVTKGSFYWHFADRDALLRATIERWEEGTEAIIAGLQPIDDPPRRLTKLLAMAYSDARDMRIARVLGSLTDPLALAAVRRVSERRLGYIAACCHDVGMTPAKAERAARLIYASYLGLADLEALGLGMATPAERSAHLAQVVAAIVPGMPAPRRR